MASVRIVRDSEIAVYEPFSWSGSPTLIQDIKSQIEKMDEEGWMAGVYTPFPDFRAITGAADELELPYTVIYPVREEPKTPPGFVPICYEPPKNLSTPQEWFEAALRESSKVFFNPYHDKRGRFTFKRGAASVSPSSEVSRPGPRLGVSHANFPQRGKELAIVQRQAKAYGWSVDEYRQMINRISDRFTPDLEIANRSVRDLEELYRTRQNTILHGLSQITLGPGALLPRDEVISHLRKQAILNQTVLAKKIRALGGVVPGEEENRPPATPPTTTPGTRGGSTSLSDYDRPFVKAFTNGLNPGWHRSKEPKEVGHSVAESRDFSGGSLPSGLTARFGIRVLPSLMKPGQFEWEVVPHFFKKGTTRQSTSYHGSEAELRNGGTLGTIKGLASGVNAAKLAAEEAFGTARRLITGDGTAPVDIASTSHVFELPKHGQTRTPSVTPPPTTPPPPAPRPVPAGTTSGSSSSSAPQFRGGITNPGKIRKTSLTSDLFGHQVGGEQVGAETAIRIANMRGWERKVGQSVEVQRSLQAIISDPRLDTVVERLKRVSKALDTQIGYTWEQRTSALRDEILKALNVDPLLSRPWPPGAQGRADLMKDKGHGSSLKMGGEVDFIGGLGVGTLPPNSPMAKIQDNRTRVLQGVNFVRAIMSAGNPDSGIERFAPNSPQTTTTTRKISPIRVGSMFDDPDEANVPPPTEAGRAYYRVHPMKKGVTPAMFVESRTELRRKDLAETAAHEYGHHLEFHLQDAPILIEKFFQNRTTNEPLEKMADLFPGSGYRSTEVTKKDAFLHPYMGLRHDPLVPGSSEMLSTAVGTLYGDPMGFLKHDPEMFRFTIGLLIRE